MVPHQPRRIVQTSLHILPRQSGILFHYIFNGITGREELDHRLRRDARAPDDRLAVADVRIDCDSF